MAFSSVPFDVTTNAQKLVESTEGASTFEIYNPSGNVSVFIGGSDVSTSGETRGREIPAGESYVIEVRGVDDDVYVIASSAATIQRTTLT